MDDAAALLEPSSCAKAIYTGASTFTWPMSATASFFETVTSRGKGQRLEIVALFAFSRLKKGGM
jgi:hypothetical protein